VQALKAGIMEIADIFVVNKADREGADRTAASIEAMLSLEQWASERWRPPVMRTVATTGAGVADVVATIARHRAQTGEALGTRRRSRAEWRLREILTRRFMQHLEQGVLGPGEFARWLDRVAARDVDPYAAADALLQRALAGRAAHAIADSLDHVGVAVREAAPFVDLFRRWFDLETDDPEIVGLHRLRFVQSGDTTVELVEAMSADAPIAKFLAKRGDALHHLCFRVADIEKAIATLKSEGVRFIDEQPRQGAHGSRIAFIHPESAGGLLVELKEPARGGH
jgi:methylmalonyl-CoA epimerase